MLRYTASFVALAVLPIGLSHAASFDCAKTRSKPELLICGDPELSRLDDELALIYAAAKAVAPD